MYAGIFDWLRDLLLWVPHKLFAEFLKALADLFKSIPAPSWMNDAHNAFSMIPSGVLYFLSVFDVSYGVAVLLTALGLRFLLRRIPFIGG